MMTLLRSSVAVFFVGLVVLLSGCDKIREIKGKFFPGAPVEKVVPAEAEKTAPPEAEKPISPEMRAVPAGVDSAELNAFLDRLIPRDGQRLSGEEITGMADLSAGIGLEKHVNVDKPIYLVYAGLENKIMFHVNRPAVVVVYQGNRNVYTFHKSFPDVGLLVLEFEGYENRYEGKTPVGVGTFRR